MINNNLHSYLSKRRNRLCHKSYLYKLRRKYGKIFTTTKLNKSIVTQTKVLLVIVVSIILCIFIFIWNKYSSELESNKKQELYTPIVYNDPKHNKWVAFGGYAGIPNYYIKKGILNSNIPQNQEEIRKLVTVTTFCDLHLLYEAQKIAINYISGPVSISVFIDADYHSHNGGNKEHSDQYLQSLFNEHFMNITNKYDVIIGILYYNKSNSFYQSKGFKKNTPLVFRLPMNPLRNLAEYQVVTDWTFNIDVDFWYLSHSLNYNVNKFIKEINKYSMVYGEKSIFIVPAFEILTENKPSYSSLNKSQLLEIIRNPPNPKQIDVMPFHYVPYMNDNGDKMGLFESNFQQCTGYNDWYTTQTNYKINYLKHNCSLYYEPWYIINTNISRNIKYKWDDRFIGRGYSKTQRVNTLRHNCFNFIVMKDLFVIHAAQTVHVKLNQTLRNHWTGKNRELLIKQRRLQYRDKNSCLTPSGTIKFVRFLRAIFLGFGSIAWDYISNANCVSGLCKC